MYRVSIKPAHYLASIEATEKGIKGVYTVQATSEMIHWTPEHCTVFKFNADAQDAQPILRVRTAPQIPVPQTPPQPDIDAILRDMCAEGELKPSEAI